ncbi:MAG: hypothetical protein ACFCU4_05555 [Puniceicoccaceae bacterium]
MDGYTLGQGNPQRVLRAPNGVSSEAGFALIISLALMSLVLGLILALVGQVRSSHTSTSERAIQESSRQNAVLSLNLALGQLQKDLGSDLRLTGTAELISGAATPQHPHWLGVWDASSNNPTFIRWLTSGVNPNPAANLSPGNSVTIVGSGTVGNKPDQMVEVPLQAISAGGQFLGRYGYWIGDESAKADIAVNEPIAEVAPTIRRSIYDSSKGLAGAIPPAQRDSWGRTLIKQSHNHRVSFDHLLNDYWSTNLKQTDPTVTTAVQRSTRYSDLLLLENPANPESLFHSLTTNNFGILENGIDGGLRFNADPAIDRALAGQKPNQSFIKTGDILEAPALPDFLDFNKNFSAVLPPNIPIALDSRLQGLRGGLPNVHPILTEATIYFAVFNRSSYPAMRFYIDAEFYNPYPFPILLNDGDARAYSIAFRNLPEIRITNATTGNQSAWLNMDTIPISRSGGDRWTASWIEFTTSGGNRPFLFPGEVYRVEDPDPARQPQGLWKAIQFGPGSAASRSIGSVQANHTIRVEGRRPAGASGFDVEVFPWRGSTAPNSSRPGDPVFAVRGIPYDNFQYVYPRAGIDVPRYLEGSGFSADIDVSDMYIFALHYRFTPRWDDPAAADLLESLDLRSREIAFNGTFVDRDGDIRSVSDFISSASTNPVDTRNNISGVFPLQDTFSDTRVRRSDKGEYRDIRPYDLANRAPLSISDLRGARHPSRPPSALGSTWGGRDSAFGPGSLNESFDRYFLSSVPANGGIWDKNDGLALPNARLSLRGQSATDPSVKNEDLRKQESARHFENRGAFNLNSISTDAWHAVLKSDLNSGGNEWVFNERRTIGLRTGFASRDQPLRNVFFKRPFSVGFDNDAIRDDAFSNVPSRLTKLSLDSTRDSSMFRNGFRALEGDDPQDIRDDQIRHLAWHIVEGIKEFGRANQRPIRSIAEFLDLGIIQDAIEKVGVATVTPEMIARRLGPTRPINEFSIPAPPIGDYPNNQHPTALKQADVAAQISPFLSHRSDVFVIRAYGESLDPNTGLVAARALIEARVQRLVDPIDPVANPNPNAKISGDRLGRKFKLISFRWIDPNEA